MVVAMIASLAVPVIALVEEMARVNNLARVLVISTKLQDDPAVPESVRGLAGVLAQNSAAFESPVGTMLAGTTSFVTLAVMLWMTRPNILTPRS
jgi:hypothetical protein